METSKKTTPSSTGSSLRSTRRRLNPSSSPPPTPATGSSPRPTRDRPNPPSSPSPTPAPISWLAPPPPPIGSWSGMGSVPPPVAPPGFELRVGPPFTIPGQVFYVTGEPVFAESTPADELLPLGTSPTDELLPLSSLSIPDPITSTKERSLCLPEEASLVACYQPFVISLAAGNLDPEKFTDYLAQHILFLSYFADAFELAKVQSDDSTFKDRLQDFKSQVLEERETCRIALKELDINPTKHIIPEPAIAKYINLIRGTAVGLLDHGMGSEHAELFLEKKLITAYTLSVMSPHMRFNANLGKHMRSLCTHAIELHPFRNWIDAYSNGNFEFVANQMEDLLQRIAEKLTGQNMEIISRLYRQALGFELEILAEQVLSQPTSVPLAKLHGPLRLCLSCNFDSTCTKGDSSAILMDIAVHKAPGDDGVDSGCVSNTILEGIMSYKTEYTKFVENLCTTEGDLVTSQELSDVLEQISEIDKRAKSRVIESGILANIKDDDIQRVCERLTLRDGCVEFFHKLKGGESKIEAEIDIISYCWCDDIIKSAFSSGCLNYLNIHSNTIDYETGEWCIRMETPKDKLEAFKKVLSDGDSEKCLSVYIGSSVSDLLCLTHANIGIVMGSSKILKQLAKLFGITFIPLTNGSVSEQRKLGSGSPIWKDPSGVLYSVSTWAEISAFVLGSKNIFRVFS